MMNPRQTRGSTGKLNEKHQPYPHKVISHDIRVKDIRNSPQLKRGGTYASPFLS
jgi:hypothetical protein